MPRFIVTMGREKVDTLNLAQDRILIGRTSKADVFLDNPMVSRRHAEVRRIGTEYMIVNLAGKNGVFVNGKWVDTSPLRNGDTIDVGKYSIRFEYPKDEAAKRAAEERKEAGVGFKISTTEMLAQIEGGNPERAERQRKAAEASAMNVNNDTFQLEPDELAKVRKTMDLAKAAHLQVNSTPPQMVDLDRDRTTVGKGADCTLKLDTGWLAPKQSLAIARRGGEHLLEVSGGTVRLNGEKVKSNTILTDGDTIEVEGIRLRFNSAMKA
jgi:predicted component of type VI protein secretion system